MSKIKIAPSILSADLLQLKEQIQEVEQNGADLIHVDVMDGQFVPNITFGPVIVRTLKQITGLPLDVHLMINNADRYIDDFAEAGADYISVHQEALPHLHRALQTIRNHGIKAGVVLNPATDILTINPVLSDVDLVLIMSVNPGFGGQRFLDLALDKITALADIRRKRGLSFEIEVDGGINSETAALAAREGVDILVAGNAIFAAENIGQACRHLKQAAQQIRERNG